LSVLRLQVEDIVTLERDEIVCVSSHKRFVRPQESQRFVELKANWGRACKQRGHRASDVNSVLFVTTGQSHSTVNNTTTLPWLAAW